MIVTPQNANLSTMRRGISLVELLVVLSGCAVVISTTGLLLHRAMRGESETRHMFDVEQAALLLSHQFRDDVHQAVEVEVATDSPDSELLRVKLRDGRSVRYTRERESVIRVLFRGEEPVAREEYRLGAAGKSAVAEQIEPRRISLTISSPLKSPLDRGRQSRASEIRRAPVSLQLIAVVGRDARFVPLSAAEEEAP